jgi:tRNA threonylcarbamoyladenosine biosynthesis protein TsaB
VKILAIECATEYRSVALALDDQIRERSAPPRAATGEPLLGWAQDLLDEAGLALTGLDLIAFSQGPGAFTGVRMGASLAQGLSFAGDLPVAGVSTLRGLAWAALERASAAGSVLVCQDARMNEVYWARFARVAGNVQPAGAEQLSAPAGVDLAVLAAGEPATGSAFRVQESLLQRWRATAGAGELLDCTPRARDIARLASLDGLARAVAPERALPVYLRHNVATPSS